MAKKLTEPQERYLLRVHFEGFGCGGSPVAARALFAAGMLGTVNGRVRITPEGRAYLDARHERMMAATLARFGAEKG